VNDVSFWSKKIEDVAAEDVFFYEYFSQIGRPDGAVSSHPEAASGEGEDEGEEDEVWNALVPEEPEDDVSLEDLETAYAETDDSGDDMDGWNASGLSSELDEDEGGDAADAGQVGNEGGDGATSESTKRASRRKRLRDLPTFASADDYADILAQEE